MVVNLAVRLLITLLAGLFGCRGFSLEYLIHPIRYDMADMNDIWEGGSIYVRRLDDTLDDKDFLPGVWWVIRKFCLLPLFPPVLALIALAVYKHVLLQAIVIAVFLLVALVVMVFFGTGGLGYLIDKWTTPKTTWYLDKDNQDLLVCGERRTPLTVGAIPFGKKTIHLRFQELKAKVCKPFAG